MQSNFLRLSAALIIIALLALATTAGTEVQAGPLAQATSTAAVGTPADEGKFPPCPDVIPQPTQAATSAATGKATTAATKAATVKPTATKVAPAPTKAATVAGTPTAITMGSMTVGPFQTTVGCTLSATLLGTNEVPQPGPAKARGTAIVIVARPATGPGTICILMDVFNIKLPAIAAHIHRGAADVAGPVVVPLQPPDKFGKSRSCTTGVDRALIKEILTEPYNFYVNVHTTDFPNGAMRGQLESKAG
jgi:CHRD domain